MCHPAPPSFCKCTCFTNSTIIELTPPTDSTTQSFLRRRAEGLPEPIASLFSAGVAGKLRHGPKLKGRPYTQGHSVNPVVDGDTSLNKLTPRSLNLDKRAPPAACTRCNRAFCLSQNLPICKAAEEKDIQTSCFQRDSRKDQFVVLGFIGVTLGLLGWAGGREAINRRKRAQDPSYVPLNRG